MSRGPVLAVAACEKGRGGGHLVRCMALVRALRALGRDAWLFRGAETNRLTASLTAQFDPAWLIGEADLQGREWECIVLDRFRTPPEEFKRWTALAPVVGIDEGGPCRNRFDFLIDILPNIAKTKPNIADPSLKNEKLEIRNEEWGSKLDNISGYRYAQATNNNPDPRLLAPDTHIKVLISFGQEDSAGLGVAVAQALAKKNNGGADITLLRGGMGNEEWGSKLDISGYQYEQTTNNNPDPRSPVPSPYSLLPTPYSPLPITILDAIPNLSNHLNEYDLIITHYGLTSFEALYAGVPVMLASPGRYHEKLAKAAGFFSSGVGKKAAAKLAALLFKNGGVNCSFLNDLKNRCAALAVRHNMAPPAAGSPLVAGNPTRQSLAELVDGFAPNVSRNCPACGTAFSAESLRTIARFPERTYRRCKNCGVIVMDRINPPPVEYDREYFFESYKKQYGKTYIEDFPHLTAMAKRRLAVIKSLLPDSVKNQSLLDIGCAYGAFLAAAREEGFSPRGIDPAEDAVRYVTQTLGIPAAQGFFPNNDPDPCSLTPDPYAVITLWYVIEHFNDCVPALAEIRKLLKPGGALAFATPSFSGVSGRSSLKRFLENSPADHRTVWSPVVCKKALKRAGFKVKKIVIGGLHPERFPLLGKFAGDKKSPLYGLLLAVSKIFALGDTFEVYAVRK